MFFQIPHLTQSLERCTTFFERHIKINDATTYSFKLSFLKKVIMKAILIFSCLFCSIISNGQTHRISINYKSSLTYLGKQTQGFDNFYFDSRSGNNTFNNAANFLYSYTFLSKFNVTTGLEFSQQGQNINFKTNSSIPENNNVIFKTQLNYFRIPITIGYSILKFKKDELNINTGVSLGFVTKRVDNYQDIILEDILLPQAEKRYKDKDLAIPIGINYQRILTKQFSAIFGVEYLVGLTNSFNENEASKFGVLSEFDNSKQNRLSINVGISINLTK